MLVFFIQFYFLRVERINFVHLRAISVFCVLYDFIFFIIKLKYDDQSGKGIEKIVKYLPIIEFAFLRLLK